MNPGCKQVNKINKKTDVDHSPLSLPHLYLLVQSYAIDSSRSQKIMQILWKPWEGPKVGWGPSRELEEVSSQWRTLTSIQTEEPVTQPPVPSS